MSESYNVYDDLCLYITSDKFYIEPKIGNNLLVIERLSEVAQLINKDIPIPTEAKCIEFCGILGSINLVAGRYLVIAKQRVLEGTIVGHSIWRLAGTQYIPYFKSTIHLNEQQLSDNEVALSMVTSMMQTPGLYFSYSYDISHTMQRLHSAGPGFLRQSLLSRADHRFVWNLHLLKGFHDVDFQNFVLPVIHGYLSIVKAVINSCHFKWCLISRRSIHRAGTRFYRRGVDRDGNVANFVETEQIIEYQDDTASFVQIRGSIPLYWLQLPDLRYKPPPRIIEMDPEDHKNACTKHLENIGLIYGKQVIVNLVDQKGSEGKLEKAFGETVSAVGLLSVRYEAFDFHSECRHLRWDRLSILLDRLSFDQDEMGYFMLMRDGSLVSLQEGVFRTNCIDCLDRTNVVQSMLARRSLNSILQNLSILRVNESVDQHLNFESIFKSVWAQNADYLSIQYSGTGALKTDFTRTGKRTSLGMLQDGINSLMRYYKNNFTDGFRQDAFDIFHGLADLRSPLSVEKGWRYITFPTVLLVAIAMFVSCTLLPSEYSTETLLFMLFWGSMVFATMTTIFHYGHEFVDKPALVSP